MRKVSMQQSKSSALMLDNIRFVREVIDLDVMLKPETQPKGEDAKATGKAEQQMEKRADRREAAGKHKGKSTK